MRYVSWVLRLLLFLLLLGFAVKNSEIVTLHYYLGYEWQAPLVLVILMFFTFGAAVGVVASLGFLFRQRRDIAALKKELRLKQNTHAHEEQAGD
jgi:lipopolysaccharide assembly protein A